MPLNLEAIGTTGDPVERTWNSKDALLYAVAVGAGTDPSQELAFTTENSRGIDQQVLPTFGVVLGMGAGGALRHLGTFNPAMLVHAEQSIELHRPIQPTGSAVITGQLVDIADKRSGALVTTESRAVDATTGSPLFTTRSGLFIRGEGGFAPPTQAVREPAPPPAVQVPDQDPHYVVSYPTLPQQPLLYRLCGDRNPLHSDPAFAARAGFERPILHGLCTYGFTDRALLHSLCGSDPNRFRSMSGRFSKPVMPGQTLTVTIWVDAEGGAATFQTSTDDSAVVLDRGRFTFT